MKIIRVFLICVFVLIFSVESFSQIGKGDCRIGGGFWLSRSKQSYQPPSNGTIGDFDVTSLYFNPNISYFFVERLSIGIITPYSISKSVNSKNETTTRNYTIGPVVRYYIPLKDWAFFFHVEYTVGWSKFNLPIFDGNGIVDTIMRSKVNSFDSGIGITYFVSKNVGLEGVLSYQRIDVSDNSTVTNYTRSTAFFSVGIQFYLTKG